MRLQWIILGGTSILALGFMVFLMCKLAAFEDHQLAVMAKRARASENRVAISAVDPPVVTSAVDPQVSAVNLRRLLLRIQRTPQRARRDRIFARINRRIAELEPHLLDILAVQRDPLVVPAIVVAGALEVKSAVLPLMLLADSDLIPVRIAAIPAKERLQPWGYDHLQGFLRESDPELLSVVIEIVAQRYRRPVKELIALLHHPKAAVRRAAGDALPPLAPGASLDGLCEMAQTGKERDACAAANALGRPYYSVEAETCLLGLLDRPDPTLRETALRSLGNKGSRIENVEPILDLIQEPSRPLGERTLALVTLERTSSVSAVRLRRILPKLHPMLRFCGARCLAVTGDRVAIRMLIDLLDTKESESVSYGARQYVRSESRELLRQISNVDLGAESARWRPWFRENPELTLKRFPRLPARAW